jgi:hypothetical protein
MKALKLSLVIGLALMLAVVLTNRPSAQEAMPEPEGEAFWTYIHDTDPYVQWPLWPGHEGMIEGQSPHGAFVKIYVNPAALDAARAGEALPNGAIVVKENYKKDKETLAAVTPMYRVRGYDEDAGDWFWAKYGPDGKVMKAGQVKGCINCHESVKDQDWIFHLKH